MVSGPEPISMLVEKAVDGRLDIPEFQRGFVWRSDQVKALVDSLFRNYPIGQILLWRNKNYVSPRSTLNGLVDVSWIVDGQQRTTALCLLFKRKPYWYDSKDWNDRVEKIEVYFNVVPQGGVFNFSLRSASIENKPEWVGVSDILNLDKTELASKARAIVKKMGDDSDERFTQIFNSIQQLHSLTEKTVYEQEIAHVPEDVAEIFGRLNSAGTKVKEADIFIALMAARNKDWVRTKFLPFIDDLEEDGFELEPGIFVRTMTSIAVGKADLEDVGNDFWSQNLMDNWTKTEDVITDVIQSLRQKGILNSDILPSKNALIPLFILRSKFGSSIKFDHAFYWFLLASRDGRYGGSSNTILTTDAQTILKANSFEGAVKSLLGELSTTDVIDQPDFMTTYNRDKFLAMLTYLTIFDKGAMDWLEQDRRIGYDKSNAVLNRGFKPEWNHFFPKGKRVLKAAGYDFTDEEVNALANITVITERANRTISSNPPETYISKLKIPTPYLDQQLLPKSRPFETGKYREFLKERSLLLAQAANDYLKKLKP